jgi:hypothetical protein
MRDTCRARGESFVYIVSPGGSLAGGGVKTSVVTGGGSGLGLGPAAARAG